MINTNSSIPIIGIYKITSPTNRIYIGQSTDIEKRFNIYRHNHCKGQHKLYRSLIKYGYHSHDSIILEECSIEQLNERERYWQDYYNVLNGGLNCKLTKTKDKSGDLSQDTKDKMSSSRIGIVYSEEVKLKLRRPILQYTIDGDFIREWSGAIEIQNVLGFNSSSISYCCLGKSKSSKGFMWKFKDDGKELKYITKTCKPLIQYDLNMNIIKYWDSVILAHNNTGIGKDAIKQCCKGNSKSSGGFIWKYN